MYTPSGIIGISNRTGASVLIDGDSIANGYKDSESFTGRNTALQWLSGGGFVSRALWGRAGSINIAVSGDTGSAFSNVTSGTNTASFRPMASARTALTRSSSVGGTTCQRPRRSRRSSPTSSLSPKPRQTGGCAHIRWHCPAAHHVHRFLVHPAAQTVHTSESVRVAYNDWIRAGCPVTPTP